MNLWLTNIHLEMNGNFMWCPMHSENMTPGTILSKYTRMYAEGTMKSIEDDLAWESFLPKTFSPSSHLLSLLHTWSKEITLSIPRGYSKMLFLHMYISHSMTCVPCLWHASYWSMRGPQIFCIALLCETRYYYEACKRIIMIMHANIDIFYVTPIN